MIKLANIHFHDSQFTASHLTGSQTVRLKGFVRFFFSEIIDYHWFNNHPTAHPSKILGPTKTQWIHNFVVLWICGKPDLKIDSKDGVLDGDVNTSMILRNPSWDFAKSWALKMGEQPIWAMKNRDEILPTDVGIIHEPWRKDPVLKQPVLSESEAVFFFRGGADWDFEAICIPKERFCNILSACFLDCCSKWSPFFGGSKLQMAKQNKIWCMIQFLISFPILIS